MSSTGRIRIRCSTSVVVAALLCAFASPAVAQDASIDQAVNALFFGELDYREREDQGDDGFVIGQAAAHFGFQLDDRLSFMTEMTATARKGEDFEFEVERLIVRYDFSDHYRLSAGRYHTPIGYWNSAFHHGSWLQTTVSRPETVKFGSNVIPIHFVGALLEGKILDSNFGYRVGVGNGRSDEINDPGDFGDTNGDRAWIFGANYRSIDRLKFDAGFSLYLDEVEPELGPSIDEQIYTGYVALQNETPEVIVEYTHARHDSSGVDGGLSSIYGQVAYRLSGRASNVKPYLRVENLDVDNDDPLLGGLDLDYEGYVAGARWDFSPYASLKAEVRSEEFGVADRRTSFWLQLSFVFDATNRRRFLSSQQMRAAAR